METSPSGFSLVIVVTEERSSKRKDKVGGMKGGGAAVEREVTGKDERMKDEG
jgi:hypothetical protein